MPVRTWQGAATLSSACRTRTEDVLAHRATANAQVAAPLGRIALRWQPVLAFPE
jgi:hypothetical protein